jgi:hypothetical protein
VGRPPRARGLGESKAHRVPRRRLTRKCC